MPRVVAHCGAAGAPQPGCQFSVPAQRLATVPTTKFKSPNRGGGEGLSELCRAPATLIWLISGRARWRKLVTQLGPTAHLNLSHSNTQKILGKILFCYCRSCFTILCWELSILVILLIQLRLWVLRSSQQGEREHCSPQKCMYIWSIYIPGSPGRLYYIPHNAVIQPSCTRVTGQETDKKISFFVVPLSRLRLVKRSMKARPKGSILSWNIPTPAKQEWVSCKIWCTLCIIG